MSWTSRLTGLVTLAVLTASATPAAAAPLNGTFRILPGSCSETGVVGGSTFRLIEPTGDPKTGPFFENPDSSCTKQTFTLLRPGSDGGLATGRFQGTTAPSPFDRGGNSRLGRIIEPVQFFGIRFGLGTFAKDPAGGTATFTAPRVTRSGTTLTGRLSAVTAGWNSQFFGQGSTTATGTYNAKTKRYTLKWSSKVSGGPFNGFTGVWSLKGQFVARR